VLNAISNVWQKLLIIMWVHHMSCNGQKKGVNRYKIGKYERMKLVDIQGFLATKYLSECLD
jgi:hypothetical protein